MYQKLTKCTKSISSLTKFSISDMQSKIPKSIIDSIERNKI